MSWDDEEDKTVYQVVINHEEQYSIWPADRENALGWRGVGKSGLKDDCLDFIEQVWTDMRPLSLRKKMEAWEREEAEATEKEPKPESQKGEDTAPANKDKADAAAS